MIAHLREIQSCEVFKLETRSPRLGRGSSSKGRKAARQLERCPPPLPVKGTTDGAYRLDRYVVLMCQKERSSPVEMQQQKDDSDQVWRRRTYSTAKRVWVQ